MSYSRAKPITLQLQAIGSMVKELQHELALSEEREAATILQSQITSSVDLGIKLSARRKTLGIELATLELQTGVSVSTLKRLFKDPDQVKFSTVRAVSAALGVRLCAVM